MSKKKKDNIDPNVKKFFEEMDAKKATEENELKEGEYIICPGCGEKISKTARTCPTCGIKQRDTFYTPISDKTAAKIRFVLGAILLVGFFVVYLFVINK